MRRAVDINLNDKMRQKLQALSRSRSVPARLAERASIVLLADEGRENREIAQLLGITRQKAGRWRERYAQLGIEGIQKDASRPGRHRRISKHKRLEVVKKTLQEIPDNATHWSRSLMAEATGLSDSTIGRIWKEHGLKPHLSRTFKLSKDKNFVEKLEDVIGLYLNPPEHAVVFSCDEKSQMQALDRTQPGLPMKKGRLNTMTHDYKRNGTTSLFAALRLKDGSVISTYMKRHRHQEWIKFLNLIKAQAPKDKEIHIICDNYATHKHPKVKNWFKRNKKFHCHFTPTSASWLNMVERFFRDLSERKLKRGIFRSVQELIQEVSKYIEVHNSNPKPFIWTASAKDILAKVKRARRTLDKLQTA